MDFKKVSSNVGGVTPAEIGKSSRVQTPDKGGPSFADTLNQKIQGPQGQSALSALTQMPTAPKAATDGIKFSNHAVERMMSRGISFSPEDMTRLNEAVTKAAAKGSKDTLVLMNNSAMIVSVKNKTVVTVMDQNALKENVFTNIDSTVVM